MAGLAQANPHWRAALTAMLCAAAWMPSAQAVADEADEAATILQQTGVRGGLVVHLGCGDGRLTAALRAGDAYLVHGLDADAANVAVARTHVRNLGLADAVWIDRFEGARLPYAENMVNLLVAHEGGIYLRQRPLFGKGRSTRFPTYLRASGGLLDTNWFHRTRWFLRAVPMAEYLVFNDERVCGVRARKRIGGYGGHFVPGAKGYELFAADLRAVTPPKPEPARPAAKPETTRGSTGRSAGASSTPKVRTPKDRWCIRVPVRVTAMLLAGDRLVAAGTPDVICDEDPWAAYEGRKGGRLLVVSADDGTVQHDMGLAAPPVLDGLAAARGRLYLATIDGSVLCLGQTK